MKGPRNGIQSVEQRGCRGVQQFISDAEDALASHRRQVLPLALLDNLLQRNAISCAAPGRQDHIGLRGRDFLRRRRFARCTDELAARGLHQMLEPPALSGIACPPVRAAYKIATGVRLSKPLLYNCHVLTEEDKQWIDRRLEEERQWVVERIEKLETTLLTEFHKWASPIDLRQRTHAAALRALDAEVESLSDRLKNLEGR